MKRIIFLPLLAIVPIFAAIALNDAKEDRSSAKKEQLYLSLNINEGAILELSDGSSYEIAPEDRLYSIYWITPFPIMLGRSENPEYPIKITNMNTGTSVNGKQISTREMLEIETKKYQEMPQTKPPKPTQRKPKTKPK